MPEIWLPIIEYLSYKLYKSYLIIERITGLSYTEESDFLRMEAIGRASKRVSFSHFTQSGKIWILIDYDVTSVCFKAQSNQYKNFTNCKTF